MKQCHACGKPIGQKATFCPYCGAVPRRPGGESVSEDGEAPQAEPIEEDKTVAFQLTPEMLDELERMSKESDPALPVEPEPPKATLLGTPAVGLRKLAARQTNSAIPTIPNAMAMPELERQPITPIITKPDPAPAEPDPTPAPEAAAAPGPAPTGHELPVFEDDDEDVHDADDAGHAGQPAARGCGVGGTIRAHRAGGSPAGRS